MYLASFLKELEKKLGHSEKEKNRQKDRVNEYHERAAELQDVVVKLQVTCTHSTKPPRSCRFFFCPEQTVSWIKPKSFQELCVCEEDSGFCTISVGKITS